MAPRLSRWIAMTVIAAVFVAMMFLSTGGTPLSYLPISFVGSGDLMWSEPEAATPLQRKIAGVQVAIASVRAQIETAELRTALSEAFRRSDADPLVFRWEHGSLVAEPALTAQLRPVWNSLPSRRPEIRTVVLVGPDLSWAFVGSASLDSSGTCIVRVRNRAAARGLTSSVSGNGGECLYSEQFGPPGDGFRRWKDGIPSGISAGYTRMNWDRPGRGGDDGGSLPAWFDPGAERSRRYGSDWERSPMSRAGMACLVGRVGQCEAAAGVAPAGWAEVGWRRGFFDQLLPTDVMHHDLLLAIGPEKFGRIWTSPDPIALSYAQVTGQEMDGWLRNWGRTYAGTPVRDNGLSLLGWIGALLWLGFFGLLTMERLRHRSVS